MHFLKDHPPDIRAIPVGNQRTKVLHLLWPLLLLEPVMACDLCAVYNASAARGVHSAGFHLAIAEQFTHSGTLQEEGKEISDPVGQFRDSSITHFIAGYNVGQRFGVSLNVPYIHRSFKRAEGFEVEKGTESGLGDIALLGRFLVFKRFAHEFSIAVTVLGGVEFPTGDSDRLREEVEEVEVPGAPPAGVHGNDLALGSGSFDGIVGVALNTSWKQLLSWRTLNTSSERAAILATASATSWLFPGGPACIFCSARNEPLRSSQALVTKVKRAIESMESNAMTAWYAGPALTFTLGERLSATANVDVPLRIYNRAFQTVPGYRVRGGLTWRF